MGWNLTFWTLDFAGIHKVNLTAMEEMKQGRWKRRHFLGIGLLGVGASMVACRSAGSPGKLLFLTDVHARKDKGAPEALAQAAAEINRLRPDLILGGGDFIHGGFDGDPEVSRERFRVFREFADQLEAPAEWMIGNHDYARAVDDSGRVLKGDPRNLFREVMNIDRTYRAFDFGAYRFVLLDPVEVVGGDLRYRGWVGAAQLKWLKEEIANQPADRPFVLCSHIPLRTTFMQAIESATAALPENLVVGNANEVLACFEGCRLELVLQGHLHVDESIRWNGTTFVMGGAVCGKWWQGANRGTEEGFGLFSGEPLAGSYRYIDYQWTPPTLEAGA